MNIGVLSGFPSVGGGGGRGGGAHEDLALVVGGRRVVPANLLREKGSRGGRGLDRLFTLRCCHSQISLVLRGVY